MFTQYPMVTLFELIVFVAVGDGFSCKDQNNEDVDWFIAYKLPTLDENIVNGESAGTGFFYMDINRKQFTPSTVTIDSEQQAIAYTLQQMYDSQADTDVFHVIYNDEPSENKEAMIEDGAIRQENMGETSGSTSYGHTKGVAFFNGISGVWLVHSVPKFPPPDRYSYPHSGTVYGQHFLCMTFNSSQLGGIGTQLFFNHPKIYSSALPTNMAATNPDLANVIGHGHKTGLPSSSVIELITVGGHTFKSFAKTAEFGQDLYDGLVAPQLTVGLDVETWRRGSLVDLNCQSQFPVLDSQYIQVGNTSKFKYTKDHAKYAVSISELAPHICLGDINRMTTQFTRGGGTVCTRDFFMWQAFNKLTVATNSC